jgi:inosine-uridine nucleoside N-ribohydrolase
MIVEPVSTGPQPYILDVDTGIDDALALALAVRSPEIELIAVSTLAGNVDVRQTTENTRRVLTWLGASNVPVHRGASRPLAKAPRHATHVHGNNGLGGVELPESSNSLGPDRGPAAIIRHATARPGEITLVCVGPLTNLAIALNVEPCLPSLLRRVVIMGGSFFNPGNVTPHAEFNMYVDPDAAQQVFDTAFADMMLVGLDVTHQATLDLAVWERAGSSQSPFALLAHKAYSESFTERGKDGYYLHDPVAVAVAVDPTLAGYMTGSVAVEHDGELRGKTTVAPAKVGVRIAESIDVERFLRLFNERLDLES